MKQIVTLTTFYILGFLFVGLLGVKAQTPTPAQSAQAYHITFPIAELGNCTSIAHCKSYCDDTSHQDACIAFAKKKGFYKETSLDTQKQTILQSAQAELGCNSEDSCRQICQQQANFEKCSAFAKKFSLTGGQQKSASEAATLQKAKNRLGCTSVDTCKVFCEKEENKQKCSTFAKETGLKGGESYHGPGGCSSQESCKDYCSDPTHSQVCNRYITNTITPSEPSHSPTISGRGQTIPLTKQEYCEKYPDHCRTTIPPITPPFPSSRPTPSSSITEIPHPTNSEEKESSKSDFIIVSPTVALQQVHAVKTEKNVLQQLWDYFFFR